jgi:hypothetical protein
METGAGCVFGNAEFGLLVPYDGSVPMQDQVVLDLISNAPQEITPEMYISRKVYLDSYTTIPKPLKQRFREVEKGCTSFEDIQALNHKPFKPEERKDGKAQAPVDWIYELLKSVDDSFGIYAKDRGVVRSCWELIRGRKPWMFAYFAVRFGYSYKDFLLKGKEQREVALSKDVD